MSTALSADGVELKVGMKVWHPASLPGWPPQTVVEVLFDKSQYWAVRTQESYCLSGVFYARERDFLESIGDEAVSDIAELKSQLSATEQHLEAIQSRLAAITQGERTPNG